MAEADGNRTRLTGLPGHNGFEDRARHQTRNASAVTVVGPDQCFVPPRRLHREDLDLDTSVERDPEHTVVPQRERAARRKETGPAQ